MSENGENTTGGVLSLDKLKGRDLTRKVTIKSLGLDVVVKKLPASILIQKDVNIEDPATYLAFGVAEPEMTDELIEALTLEEANEIAEAISDFNEFMDDVEEAAASRRKAFPA